MLVKINKHFVYDTEENCVYHIMPRSWFYDPMTMEEKLIIIDDDGKPICLTKKEINLHENTRRIT